MPVTAVDQLAGRVAACLHYAAEALELSKGRDAMDHHQRWVAQLAVYKAGESSLASGKSSPEVISARAAVGQLDELRASMNIYHDASSRHPENNRCESHHHIYAYCAHMCRDAVVGLTMLGVDELTIAYHPLAELRRSLKHTMQWLDHNQKDDELLLRVEGWSEEEIKEFFNVR